MLAKICVVWCGIFLTSLAFAKLNWNQVRPGSKNKLDENLIIKNSNSTFLKNSFVSVIERSTLDMVEVEFYKMKINQCKNSDEVSALELYELVQPNGKKISVGIEMQKKCELEIYVELRDVNTFSFLK